MAGETCGAYVRKANFTPWSGELKGNDGFYKSEAWPYWTSALAAKLQVGGLLASSQSVLSTSDYAEFNARFQRMRSDFDSRYLKIQGYGNFTFWCKYLQEGMNWDVQFKVLRNELQGAITSAQRSKAAVRELVEATTGTPAQSTSATAATATPAAKKEAQKKADKAAKKESAPAKKAERKKATKEAVKATGGDTEAAAEVLTTSGQKAGTVAPTSPMDIALWVGGGVLALGLLWTFIPEAKPKAVEKVLDKVLPTPGTATAGLGSFGRYRRHRRR